jgi:hypothetical protein
MAGRWRVGVAAAGSRGRHGLLGCASERGARGRREEAGGRERERSRGRRRLQLEEGARARLVKGKCALGPFLSILVIECQHKCLNVNLYPWMDKVQIKSKGMFLSLSTLVLCTNILV